ncbi:rod shape-determining protein [Companilactobacillus sp.]|jgi:rod shape-determining protein MreB|uniref:rod shape-determining protein n=1 Tax=Companilactobacillus sp. TaxID=2767905 RepID=UPI0025BCF872|nr:rod shape-determining protein [Companilactobacillus sp.]MCH4008476.1 rod shape-determining protein [Companilactobacillus sp.]MCH4051345.1 rod shape-determining protein [Companilactobacillus sp.]MCH4076419.1 rod shape-determining protein [Companilactobacillus sp.]MCH4124994.1 rod shape-determining protein [Companilactobacillus sp.]MCH4131536.1 rod shape-determining protein [Companilactobacillus sp.]
MAKYLGIDLGTANVLIDVKGEGIVLNEPSIVAINSKTNDVVAVGKDAYQMVGRTPANITAIRPLKDGVIADFNITEKMLQYFIDKLNVKSFFSKPVIMICAPTNVTPVEQKSIIEAAEQAGGGKVYLQLEPKVAAVGAGLDIFKPQGNMVIDIGGGTSDIAVLSMGDVVTSRSLRFAGDKMTTAIQTYVKAAHNLIIGERTAEAIKMEIGSAEGGNESTTFSASGIDIVSGLPKEITLNEKEIEDALRDGINQIIESAKSVLEETPPELSADIIDRGIMLTGGGALLKNLDKLLSQELEVPVLMTDRPLDSVALGTGILLENIEKHKKY